MRDLWKTIKSSEISKFRIKVTFLEIYNEEIFDLLRPGVSSKKLSHKEKTKITIREELNGKIVIYGLIEKEIDSLDQMLDLVKIGCLTRTTAFTLMNQTSSRSHAIFSIYLEQKDLFSESKYLTAKFNLVDLAGSERMKKTGAMGNTLKEGIHINCGLLALGNVITFLSKTGKSNKYNKAPYRVSKLTRILQDSMGGNSHTYMIACISGEEGNFEESLSTLYYASKTRLIKNKPIANKDKNYAIVEHLNYELFHLKKELIKYKRFVISDNYIRTKWESKFGENKENYDEEFEETCFTIKENGETEEIKSFENEKNRELKEKIERMEIMRDHQRTTIERILDLIKEKTGSYDLEFEALLKMPFS